MKNLPRCVSAAITMMALLMAATAAGAQTQDILRAADEPDLAFAERVLRLTADDDPHLLAAAWNGAPTLFVDFLAKSGDETDRPIVALTRQPNGRYRLVHITVGEEEGATASLAAIGFADADHSGGQALIAILTWDQEHHGLVSGTLYEVRLFAAPRPDQTQLTPMAISRHFDAGCECRHGDGPAKHPQYRTHYRFKTIAAIKRELRRMRF